MTHNVQTIGKIGRLQTSYRPAGKPVDDDISLQSEAHSQWLQEGCGFLAAQCIDGSAGLVLKIEHSAESRVEGWVQFPERGDFVFKGSLPELARLAHNSGWRGLSSDEKFTCWYD